MLIRGDDSAINLPSTLTEEEKWYFDLHGYLILRQVITPDEVLQMLSLGFNWLEHPAQAAPPLRVTVKEYGGVINPLPYGDRIFERTSLNEKVLRVVMGLMWNRPRLFNCALVQEKKDPSLVGKKKKLHRDTSGFDFPDGFRNPHNDYQAGNGQIYSNFVNSAITLVDVPKENGFTCIPGTHKSEISFPADLDIDSHPWAPTETFELQAGDCLIFSPRLMHGTEFWKMDYDRMVIFNRYQFSFYFNENYSLPIKDHANRISADQFELESIQRGEKEFARCILDKMKRGEDLC